MHVCLLGTCNVVHNEYPFFLLLPGPTKNQYMRMQGTGIHRQTGLLIIL